MSKWCPERAKVFAPIHSQPTTSPEHAVQRHDAWSQCIGSRCALWRPVEDDQGHCGLIGVGSAKAAHPDPAGGA